MMKCSFCGKSKNKVRKMVDERPYCICDLCTLEVLNHFFYDKEQGFSEDFFCSFCGPLPLDALRPIYLGESATICMFCLQAVVEIMYEELEDEAFRTLSDKIASFVGRLSYPRKANVLYRIHWFYPIFKSQNAAVDQRLIGTWASHFYPKAPAGLFFTVKKDYEGWMKFGYRSLSPFVCPKKTKLVEKLAREGQINPKKRHRMKYVNFEMGYEDMWIRWDQYYRMYVSKLGDRTFLNMKYLDRYYLLEYELFGEDTLYTYRIDSEFIEKAIADKTFPGEIFELGAPHEDSRLVKCNPALVRAHIRDTPQPLLFPIQMRSKWKRLDSQQTELFLKYFESY